MARAYAVNAVIVSDDGSTVRYHAQCPKCGTVDTVTTGMVQVLSHNRVFAGSSFCRNCRSRIEPSFARDC